MWKILVVDTVNEFFDTRSQLKSFNPELCFTLKIENLKKKCEEAIDAR